MAKRTRRSHARTQVDRAAAFLRGKPAPGIASLPPNLSPELLKLRAAWEQAREDVAYFSLVVTLSEIAKSRGQLEHSAYPGAIRLLEIAKQRQKQAWEAYRDAKIARDGRL